MAQPEFKLIDSTGRLLKYDPRNQRVTTLLSGLSGVGGPAVSSDRKYVLVPDPKSIKRAVNDGEFWVAAENPTQGLRVNGSATVLQTVPLTQFSGMTVSVVQEINNALYVGSSDTDFVGVYTN
ncbi:strictosidine synthase 2 [Artemisia annua]|uniref:Strictosidine synthase 2 n=1 Tax=Artemisia annua TaxID=35608 RepID=A0A2U1NK69_ARTAN|nr:strictosidine synthase 2 [Artemisia annua]